MTKGVDLLFDNLLARNDVTLITLPRRFGSERLRVI
jgi:hypothetical protein